MHAKRTPTNGFEKLVTQINIGVMYAQYVDHPIPEQEMVDTFIMVWDGMVDVLGVHHTTIYLGDQLFEPVCRCPLGMH